MTRASAWPAISEPWPVPTGLAASGRNTWTGPHDPARDYEPGDLALDGDNLYVCTVPVSSGIVKYAEDTFQRPNVSNGWGTASDGVSTWELFVPPWTDGSGIARAAALSVQNGEGLFTYDADGHLLGTGSSYLVFANPPPRSPTMDLLVRWKYDQPYDSGLWEAVLNTNQTWDWAAPDVEIDPDASWLWIYPNPNGGLNLPLALRDPALSTGTWYVTRIRSASPFYGARTWADGTSEPSTWDISGTFQGTFPPGCMILQYWYNNAHNQLLHFSHITLQNVPGLAPSANPGEWTRVARKGMAQKQAYAAKVLVTGDTTLTAPDKPVLFVTVVNSCTVTLPAGIDFPGGTVVIAAYNGSTVTIHPASSDGLSPSNLSITGTAVLYNDTTNGWRSVVQA